MKRFVLDALFTATFVSLILSGCNGSSSTSDENGNNPGTEKSVVQNPALIKLVPPESEEEFISQLKLGISEATSAPIYEYDDGVMIDDEVANGSEGDSFDSGTSDNAESTDFEGEHSETNLQVAGVDEADIAKTDGNYLYVVEQLHYEEPLVGITDVEIAAANSAIEPTSSEPSTIIHISKITESPAQSTAVSKIELIDKTNASIYLLEEDQDITADKLIAVSSNKQRYNYDYWYTSWYWNNGQVMIDIYDINNQSQPQLDTNLRIDGHIIQSRRIGNTLYLVSRYTPTLEGIHYYPTDDDEIAKNQKIIETANVNQLLPHISLNDGSEEPLVTADNCFVPSGLTKEHNTDIITTVTAIDITSPDTFKSVCYLGNSDAIYTSLNSIYIADSQHGPFFSTDPDKGIPELVTFSDAETDSNNQVETEQEAFDGHITVVHKFSLLDQGPKYRGTGAVPGSLGWPNPSYRMGERNGELGLVTSYGTRNHQLFILEESDDNNLQIKSRLPNQDNPSKIGKPGEDIYAARFIGDRVYIVTFERIDPLYVISIEDTANPVIMGELEIPGYSSYLHALSDSVLIGLGKDARTINGRTSEEGIKLNLFDVSNPAEPLIIQALIIGDKYTSSQALFDPHAFTFLKGTNERPHRIAFPVSLYKYASKPIDIEDPDAPLFCTDFVENDDCTFVDSVKDETIACLNNENCILPPPARGDYSKWIHKGLYLFEAFDFSHGATPNIQHVGTVTSEQATENLKWPTYNRVDRGFIQGDAIHYTYGSDIFSQQWPKLVE